MANEATIAVTVVYSPGPRQVSEWTLRLTPPGCAAGAAGQWSGANCTPGPTWPPARSVSGAAGVAAQIPRDEGPGGALPPTHRGPKIARRERFVRQGARTAGLFANKRPGSKAGY